MRVKIAIIIFWYMAGLLISELHQLIHQWPEQPVNVFVDQPRYPPDLEWVVKDTTRYIKDLFWLWAAYRTAVLIHNKLADIVIVLMIYTVGELILYFLCYGIYGYGPLYLITGVFAFLILRRK